MHAGARVLLALLSSFAFGAPACAYTLEPSLVLLRPAGGESSAFVRLVNRNPKPEAVEITIHEHAKDIEGAAITGAPADEQFLVYPAQVVLMPGDEVGVQVRWMGDPALARERAFTLVAREVAIPRAAPLPEANAGMRVDVTVLVNYEARLYVTPRGVRARVVVESVTDVPPAAGRSGGVDVVLANEGSSQQALTNLSLLLMPVDASGTPVRQQAVTVPALAPGASRAPLLAGERRRLHLPRPEALPAGRIHVQLSP